MQVIEDGVRHVRRDAEQPRRLRDGEAQSGHFLVLPTHSQRERGDGHFERRPATRTPGTPAREGAVDASDGCALKYVCQSLTGERVDAGIWRCRHLARLRELWIVAM